MGLADTDRDDVAGSDVAPTGVVDQEPSVDLRSLRAQAPLEKIVGLGAGALDEGFKDAALQGAVFLAGDRLLDRKQERPAPFLFLVRDGVAERLGGRARLRGVGENAQVV